MTSSRRHDRRDFLRISGLAAGTFMTAGQVVRAADSPKIPNKICGFIKFIQSLPFDQLAQTMAELGYDGIEATVRDGGHVLPERVEEDLPKLVEALKKHRLEITVMASSVNRADDPLTEKVLRTAAGLGVTKYRMSYYRYDVSKPVLAQLDEFRPMARELAAMNRELGITAVYQNHSGARYVGAPVWDLPLLLKGISPQEIGIAYDIRHATVEGGQAWPLSWNLVQPHLGVVYFKDFVWDGRRPKNMPLGAGQVDPAFAKMLVSSGYKGPISVHVEYLEDEGVEENIDGLRNDLITLRKWLNH